jgi:hypothetical protein
MGITLYILFWILVGIIALALFLAPLFIWHGISCLRDETRRTNQLLEELIDTLIAEEDPDTSDLFDQQAHQKPAAAIPGRPVYEIKHP